MHHVRNSRDRDYKIHNEPRLVHALWSAKKMYADVKRSQKYWQKDSLTKSKQRMLAANMSAQETVDKLKKQLRYLRRRARSWRPDRSTILEPTTRVKLGSVLILILSEDATLASLWGQRQQQGRRRHDGLWPVTVTPLLVQAWSSQYAAHPRITAALASFTDDLRKLADEFLMESLLAEEVLEQNRKGIVMCPRLMLESYLRKWRARPRAPSIEKWLCELQSDTDRQEIWRRTFRRRWLLDWSNLPEHRCLGKEDIRVRSEVFLRWVRWVLQQIGSNDDTVVVNIDETMVSNVKDRKKGIVVSRKRQRTLDNANISKRQAAPRCSLVACVTNCPDVQEHLPQIFLPRGQPDKQPPANIREVFLKAGAPLEAWHGTSGFLSAAGAASVLTRLRTLVRKQRPGAHLVVIWDASVAHTNERVLRHARKLGIHIVLVPGRLTWFLQPLDVYVFVCLKRHLRYALNRERMRDTQAKLSVAEQLACCTEAVQTTLVCRSWSHQMKKCGISPDGAGLNQKLATLVQNSDLTPCPPTCEELQSFMGCSARRAARVRALLVDHLVHPVPRDTSAIPASSTVDHAHDDMTEMSTLRPVLEPVVRSTTATSASINTVLATSLGRMPVGRRLTPVPRNLMVRPLPPTRDSVGLATRSQHPRLVLGVLETDSQTRRGTARSSWE